MLLPALVLDTNDFARTGKIRVRIQKYYYPKMTWDMENNPEFVTEGYNASTGDNGDFDVFVMSPFGVGKNCSLFYLPRVNSKGLVQPLINNQSRQFVWVGGYFDTVTDASTQVPSVTVPSQNVSKDNEYGIDYGFWKGNKDAFVFRTKSTSMPTDYSTLKNKDVKNDFSWGKNFTENLIIMDEDKIQIRHFSEYDKDGNCVIYEDVYIGTNVLEYNKDGTVKTKEELVKIIVSNKVDTKKIRTNIFTLSENGTTVRFEDAYKKTTNTIYINSDAITMVASIKEKTSTIKQKGDNITLNLDNTVIAIEKEKISIAAEKAVYIAAPEVHLGSTGQRVVTTTSSIKSFKLPDGTILSSSSKVFG